jgi:predicted nucleic acid-binding protein
VAGELILETTFVIDLEREVRRASEGPAIRFLAQRPSDILHLTFTVIGELACGASLADRLQWEAFIEPFNVIGFTPDVGWRYGEAYRHLERNGLLIGTNDLWIAATAISRNLPLVTRNVADFQRVPHLRLLPY